jgi:hypothetical protein
MLIGNECQTALSYSRVLRSQDDCRRGRCKMRMSGLCKVEMSAFRGGWGRHGNGANGLEPNRAGARFDLRASLPLHASLWEAVESRLTSQLVLLGRPPHPSSLMTRMGISWSTSPCLLIRHGLSLDYGHGVNGEGSTSLDAIEPD